MGIKVPTAQIVALAEEIDRYRDTIHLMETKLNETTTREIYADQEALQALGFVRDTVPPGELWAQLAEEATELAHAALKLRRATGGENPTPVEYEAAFSSVMEEVADVSLMVQVLALDEKPAVTNTIRRYKLLRWRDRLQGKSEGVRL
jgi:hypothetical protein